MDTYIRSYCELIVFLLQFAGRRVVSPNLNVIAKKCFSVAVDPVEHLESNLQSLNSTMQTVLGSSWRVSLEE